MRKWRINGGDGVRYVNDKSVEQMEDKFRGNSVRYVNGEVDCTFIGGSEHCVDDEVVKYVDNLFKEDQICDEKDNVVSERGDGLNYEEMRYNHDDDGMISSDSNFNEVADEYDDDCDDGISGDNSDDEVDDDGDDAIGADNNVISSGEISDEHEDGTSVSSNEHGNDEDDNNNMENENEEHLYEYFYGGLAVTRIVTPFSWRTKDLNQEHYVQW